jgi:hypothetical protein
MSFNRSNADIKAYKDTVDQSKGPGEYQLYSSPVLQTPCYAKEPTVRLQKNGVSVENRNELTDIHSNLLGISVKKDNIEFGESMCRAGYPCSGGINAKCLFDQGSNSSFNGKECFLPVESTRLSNPPCTLRGLDYDRLDVNICLNPQKNIVEMPFEHNVSIRLSGRDNFIPCVFRLNDVELDIKKVTETIEESKE